MIESWFNEVGEPTLFTGLFVVLVLASEVGFFFEWKNRPVHPEALRQASAVQAAVLGLLALLLGFTFSLAVSRFEARSDLLRDEANAIEATYLRAQFLREPMQSRVRSLLRAYAETRLELQAASFYPAKRQAVHARATALHLQLWDEAVLAGREDPESEMSSLFIAALNDTIKMHGFHMAAIRNDVPAQIFVLLFFVAVISLGIAGFASGPDHRQALALNALVALLITVVTLLVFDLQRPTRGFIVAQPASLLDLREFLRDH